MTQIEPKAPGWMMTFGDTMSLLVTFFVMLMTFSQIEEARLMELMGGLKGAFGLIPSLKKTAFRVIGRHRSPEPTLLKPYEVSHLSLNAPLVVKRFREAELEKKGFRIFIRMLDEGIAILIHADPVFKPGSPELRKEGNEALFRVLANLVSDISNEVRIGGVVPGRAVADRMPGMSPWRLAAARAVAFERGLVETCDLSPARMGIGVSVLQTAEPELDGLPTERIEFLIVEKQTEEQIPPEEIIISERWQ